jgi:AbrB family looped-hinge helix DNA binding protein
MTTVQVGNEGQVSIPADLRQAVGIADHSYVVVQKVGGGILLRPASQEVEQYTPERIAEFLLNGAIDDSDYAEAMRAVREMGLDPQAIPHDRP